MHRLVCFAMLLLGLWLSPQSLRAQSITLSPASPTVTVAKTLQFASHATGLTPDTVTWSAGGVVGGNSTVGTISATGLYTAPASAPPQNPVTVTATSTANTAIKGSTYVLIQGLGPTITSVAPNPLAVGTINVTIKGSGFMQGAVVFDKYGTNAPIALSTQTVTSTAITAVGYQAPSSTATFTVRNPGTDYSNALVVPVGSSTPTLYTLKVENGSGSGSYAAGTVVTVTANAPPAGQTFLNWTGPVADPGKATTTVTMPAANTSVAAHYTGGTTTNYTLTVVNGSGNGTYAAGASVAISANAAPAGQAFVKWTGATVASPTSPNTTLTMPATNTTVTANYTSTGPVTYTLTVVNGTGSGSYTAGSTVTITANPAAAGQQFKNWTGGTVANATAPTTTLTMPAAATTLTANYTAAATIPYPVSTHPRLWLTPADLPRLQGWAVASNPIYAQGILPVLNQVVHDYNTYYFPGGVAANPFPDPGDVQGYGILPDGAASNVEEQALVLAFNSLIDPSAANRIKYAQYARNLLMVAMTQAAQGHAANQPFRDPMFAVYNRANATGHEWGLIVDWIYNAKDGQGNPILTAADKATIRGAFLVWANDCLNAYTSGGDHPYPMGVTNSLQLLPNNRGYRPASNNYYLGHARLLTLMSLSFDPADDPAVDPTQPVSVIGNSLRSYILDANGAWLYQEFAMMGDPQTVATAYNIPGSGAGLGLASGGFPPEGMLYGHSFGFILGQLLALQTAGFNSVATTGPQAALIGAPVWDRFVTAYLSSMTPTAQTYNGAAWMGPVYELACYGDLLRLWVTPDTIEPFALLALLDQYNGGNAAHANAARWMAINGLEGGAGQLLSRVSRPWSYGVTDALMYFLLMDPAAVTPTDPRPAFPAAIIDPGNGRIVAHSDWSPSATMFDYRSSWETINHQNNDGGQFELYRKGEWLTKEMSNYDNNALGMTTMYHNTLALKNWSANGTPGLAWFETGEWNNGSQWNNGQSAGDPVNQMSSGTGYVYANSDLTKLYNKPNVWNPPAGATDITQATRSILWLNTDYVVVYDRATTQHSGLFKRFNLSLINAPTVNGNVATETLGSGQQLFVQTLLPKTPSIKSVYAAGNLSPIALLEPTQYIMTVEDLTQPTDTRFLHVLQGADPGAPMVAASYTQSTAGTAFEGAAFGGSVVYFPVNAVGSFTGTTLPAPAGVHSAWVAGLAPNASYGVSVQPSGAGNTIAITAGGSGATADSAGLLKVTF